MSGIISFIKGLNKRVERAAVLEDIDTTIKELNETTLPALASVAEQGRVTQFKSDYYKKLERELHSIIKFQRKGPNAIFDLHQLMSSVGVNTAALRKVAEDSLEQDTLSDAITARGAHIIRAASAMSFLSRFGTNIADYVMQQEIATTAKEPVAAPPAHQKYMEETLMTFLRVLADYSIPAKDFNKIFADMPSIYLDKSNAGSMSSMFNRQELDPFKYMGSMTNFRGNPIYHIRLMWTDWESKRYHAARERRTALELRLIHLKNLQADKPNPRVEQEIEGVQRRINKYDQELFEIEESIKD